MLQDRPQNVILDVVDAYLRYCCTSLVSFAFLYTCNGTYARAGCAPKKDISIECLGVLRAVPNVESELACSLLMPDAQRAFLSLCVHLSQPALHARCATCPAEVIGSPTAER